MKGDPPHAYAAIESAATPTHPAVMRPMRYF
jgi:hypothetical protein